jgi:membrane-associated protease RseP (regulator of RpoE activity)
MRSSIHFIALATAIAFVLPASADARPRGAALAPAAPPRAPAPPPAFAPLAPLPPALAMAPVAPLAPLPPLAALIEDAPPMPPGAFARLFGKGRLGVQVSSMTPELRRFFGAPTEVGLLVQGVERDTPASKAGLVVGDVIVAVDGDDTQDIEDVGMALSDRGRGDVVKLEVIRGKKRRTLKAELRDDAGGHVFAPGALHGGSVHVFGGDDDALRSELEALRERMERLERQRSAPAAKKQRSKPKAAPRPDPKKT